MDNVKSIAKKLVKPVLFLPNRAERKSTSQGQQLATGHERIYFYHIRKTAGTSLNMAFLGLHGNGHDLNQALHRNGRWLNTGERIFVRADRHLIEEGFYFQGASHIPAHELRLPDNSFRMTCLRDPVDRVISHYRMLCHFQKTDPTRCAPEIPWIEGGLTGFIENTPKEHLQRQLYMFSETFDPDEASGFLSSLDYVMLQSTFEDDLIKLGQHLNLELKQYEAKKYSKTKVEPVTKTELQKIREVMHPEYVMLNNFAPEKFPL